MTKTYSLVVYKEETGDFLLTEQSAVNEALALETFHNLLGEGFKVIHTFEGLAPKTYRSLTRI
ncbi:hypothetical protein H0266_10765 [Halobacillus locisalis]|uniref:Uncharacterized protein n=1 Tax=Halobacillus locisalis TaxID=220753 RepID=A0A838CUC4_9BACI|nr:hypothetical protein [Halobacillus locisalis]MBA2175375.1 hypothetical protein [Halobacillus locisalis]